MKTTQSKDPSNTKTSLREKVQQLVARASAAEKVELSARAHWRGLKLEQKQARKAFKQAKKAAKLARREAKIAMKAARTKLIKPARLARPKSRKSSAVSSKPRATARLATDVQQNVSDSEGEISIVLPTTMTAPGHQQQIGPEP